MTTTIVITPDVRITTDATCTTIERRAVVQYGKRAGETRWDSVGHYPSIALAAKALGGRHHHLVAGLGQSATLVDITDAVKRAEVAIMEALRP